MFASIAAAVRRHPLVAYVALAYAITWAVAAPLVARAQGWLDTGVPYALHYLAQFGPMLAALAITAVVDGRAGLRELAGRAARWRIGAGWLLVAALSPAALYAFAAAIARVADRAWPDPRQLGQVNFLPALGLWALPLWLATNGVGEELGWRGFALTRLQRGRSALAATLLLWVVWAGWHLPAFFYLPNYRAMGLVGAPGFALGILAGAILLTWLYNSTSGSLLAVILWHGMFNFFTASQAGQGTVAMVMSIAVMVWAVAALALAGPARLSRGARPDLPTPAPAPAGA